MFTLDRGLIKSNICVYLACHTLTSCYKLGFVKKLPLTKEREILGAKLDFRNACAFVARAMRLGMDDMLARAEKQRNEAEKALLRLTLPYAHLSGEFRYEMLALHGEDGMEAINEIEMAISKRNVDYLMGYSYALEFDQPIDKLML